MSAEPVMRGNWRVYRHASIDSTNLEALRLAEREALPWTVVVADTQTEGRGRLGRTWTDVPGRCLLMTALASAPPGAEGLLTAAMALAVAEALSEEGARGVGVKWPNDVLAAERKVAGILAEGPVNSLVAIGIGLNANGSPDDLPDELRARAGFISSALGRALDLLPLADAILERFEGHHFSLMAGRCGEVTGALREYDCLAGRRISARAGDEVIAGRVEGWTDDGRLAIIDSDGQEMTLDAGEVTLS